MKLVPFSLAALGFFVACGGSPPPETPKLAAIASAAPSASASAPASAAPAPSASAAPPPTEHHWNPTDTVLPGARAAMRLDMKKLRDTPFFTSVMAAVKKLELMDYVDDASKKCGFTLHESIDELVVSGDDDPVIAARITVPPDKALACIRTLGKVSDTTFRGQPALKLDSRGRAIVAGDILLLANESQLGPALERRDAPPTPLAQALALASGDVAVVRGRIGEGGVEGFAATLTATTSDLALQVHADFGDEDTARMFAQRKDMMINFLPSASQTADARALFDTIRVRQEGKTLFLDMGIHGDAKAQAQYINAWAQLASDTTKKFIAQSKAAEARANVFGIAMGLQSFGESHGKFPPSAPAVPAAPPKGKKYQSTPQDWANPSWKAVQFSMSEPQFYSYSFTTSPNGQSVTVLARGDLNGDGKPSRFEMKLDIKKTGQSVSVTRGSIKGTDEFE